MTLDDAIGATNGATAQEPAKPAQIIQKYSGSPCHSSSPGKAQSAPAPSGMMTVLIPQDEDDGSGSRT